MRTDPTIILTARTIYQVATYEQYVAAHEAALTAFLETGVVVTPHRERESWPVRINFGRWLVDCVCGAGAAADPDFPDARCFYCGAIMPVVFPEPADRILIESLLLARPVANRNWRPLETTAEVARINARHGIGGLDALD